MEAVKQSLTKLSNEEVVVKVIHGGVGAINESDVSLAATSNAIIIGFNVRPDATAKQLAEQEGVDLRLYRVIYQAIEDVEAAMKGMLDPVFEEKLSVMRKCVSCSKHPALVRLQEATFWMVFSRETARFVFPEKASRYLKVSLHP